VDAQWQNSAGNHICQQSGQAQGFAGCALELLAVMMGIPVSLLGKNYDALNLLRVTN